MLASQQKRIDLVLHLYFAAYILLAAFLFQERILYGDSAYFLFKMINAESFNIEHGRSLSFLFQILPVAAIKLGASLKVIVLAYSVNLAIWPYIVFLIIRYGIKEPVIAIFPALFTCLFVHHSFYFPLSKLFHGTMLVMPLIAYLWKYRTTANWLYASTFSLLTALAILYLHIGIIIPTAAVLVYLFVSQHFSKRFLLPLGIFAVAFIFKKLLIDSGGGYYSGEGLPSQSIGFYISYFKESWLVKFFATELSKHFVPGLILISATFLYFLFKRKWLKLLLFTAGSISLFLLAYTYLPYGEALAYMELYSGLFYAFIVFVIVHELFRAFHKKQIALLALAIVLSLSLLRIDRLQKYEKRVAWYANFTAATEDFEGSKFYQELEDFNAPKLMIGWAVPYESLLYTSMHSHSRTLYINSEEYDLSKPQADDVFIGAWWEGFMSTDTLNQKYFKLQPGVYKQLGHIE